MNCDSYDVVVSIVFIAVTSVFLMGYLIPDEAVFAKVIYFIALATLIGLDFGLILGRRLRVN